MVNEYRDKWAECLKMIRERLGDQHKYDVWFKEITLYSYDPDRRLLVLQVPNKHVYEYMEENYVALLSSVLRTVFNTNVVMNYYLPSSQSAASAEPDFSQIIDRLAKRGFNVAPELPQVRVENAEQRMRDTLQQALGERYQWLPVYDKVAAWLTDNKGRGLFCIGINNTGKTVLCTRVLPLLVGFENVAVASAIDMTAHNGKAARIDELLKARCIVIDGLGTEGPEVNHYGRIRRPLVELCDAAEQQGKLLILTTSCLSTAPMPDDWPWKHQYPTSIGEYYGDHTLSVLRRITTTAMFDARPTK